jgi:hypothetical protein
MGTSTTRRRCTRAAITVMAATALVGAGAATSPAGSATPPGTVLRVAITANGMYLDGPTTFPAGRVHLYVDASGKDRSAAIIRLHPGYSFPDFRADLKTAGANLDGPNGNQKKGLAAIQHAIANITAVGGLSAHDGQERHGIVMLHHPGGHYVLFDDSGSVPRRPVALTVTDRVGPQRLPATDATVTAKTNKRFGGDDVLPAHGNITFVNHSTESPHFLVLQHVKEGTTRKDILDSFQSDQQPDWVLKAEQNSDALTTGRRMVLRVHLPAGEYAEMCFFPDPQTGVPHAFMGMVRIVHLK